MLAYIPYMDPMGMDPHGYLDKEIMMNPWILRGGARNIRRT